ncbi:Splicing factor 3A subunit 2 [Diplonema papillatum]|nr:Splicing factor 3A subunit 2 [Diplonema papillatum]WGM49954.1 SF3A2 [Diplonema papillatum]
MLAKSNREVGFSQTDLEKDKWFSKNALGHIECRLCLTTHKTEGNYMAHAQGRRHQTNLLRKEEEKAKNVQPASVVTKKVAVAKTPKIGRPGYQVQRKRDPTSGQRILNFQVYYADIREGVTPRHRIMSAFEQKKEPPDNRYQYLLFAAEPYETIAFKIPGDEIEQGDSFFATWDKEKQVFTLEFAYRLKKNTQQSNQHPSSAPSFEAPPPPPPGM